MALEDDVKGLAAGLGYPAADSWADRETPFTGRRSFVRIVTTEQVPVGSNLTVWIAEVDCEFAARLAPLETYEQLHTYAAGAMFNATDLLAWTVLPSVRQSPVPEVEVNREPAKVGQVIVFGVRARVALEA